MGTGLAGWPETPVLKGEESLCPRPVTAPVPPPLGKFLRRISLPCGLGTGSFCGVYHSLTVACEHSGAQPGHWRLCTQSLLSLSAQGRHRLGKAQSEAKAGPFTCLSG